jgi:hypothetical protein
VSAFEVFLRHAPLFHGDEIAKRADVEQAMRREQLSISSRRQPPSMHTA